MEKLAGGVSHAENVTLPNRYLAKKTNKSIDGEGCKVLQRGRPWRNHPSDEVVANIYTFLDICDFTWKKRRLLEVVLKKLVGLCSTIFFHFYFPNRSPRTRGIRPWKLRDCSVGARGLWGVSKFTRPGTYRCSGSGVPTATRCSLVYTVVKVVG